MWNPGGMWRKRSNKFFNICIKRTHYVKKTIKVRYIKQYLNWEIQAYHRWRFLLRNNGVSEAAVARSKKLCSKGNNAYLNYCSIVSKRVRRHVTNIVININCIDEQKVGMLYVFQNGLGTFIWIYVF